MADSSENASFNKWLEEVRVEALAKGYHRAEILDHAFSDLKPIERVLELDRRQPEFTLTFWGYLDSFISQERIERGRKLLKQHQGILNNIYRQYGVQPRFLVAFWGVETNFGDFTGGFPVIGALATLAYDERRSAFFRSELFHALKILDEGHISADQMMGSWAGAMGQLQFMPSTFTGYATDGNGDGKKDIWGTLPDVFASASNYLSQIGWDGSKTWGREVLLPKNFNPEQSDLKILKSLSEWQALGVRKMSGSDLPNVDIEGSIILPAGINGPAFMVYGNFSAIMTWNRSIYYALAVGHLSDRLKGQGALKTRRPVNEKPLHREDILDMQRLLNQAGFKAGKPDGMIGSMTRAAVKSYQKAKGLPADGYPTCDLLQHMRGGQGD